MLLHQNALPQFQNAKARDYNEFSISTICINPSQFLTISRSLVCSLHHPLIDESVVSVTYGCEVGYNGECYLSGIYAEVDNKGAEPVRRLGNRRRKVGGQLRRLSCEESRARRLALTRVYEDNFLNSFKLDQYVFSIFYDSLRDRLPESNRIKWFVLAQAAQDRHL